ncbi:MAG TPA: two-component regulator propeller domain-containing protein [Puia sp.]|nr:two-component regulator propeller domain-containing protein [Puia sp.]
MTGKITSLLCCCLLGGWFCQAQTPAIGMWRDHLPYHQAIAVTGTGSRVYCATPYSIFWIDNTDNSLHRLSKTNGLSETGIRAICYDAQRDKLTIAYANSNIDILSGSQVFNIPDIRRTSLAGDKMINQAMAYNGYVYLSTSLGIIVLDEDKYEVKDSYVIGNNGDTLSVQSLATDGNYFYAATTEGIRKAPAGSTDLADYHNWNLVNDGGGAYGQVVALGSKVLGLRNDSVLVVTDQGGDQGGSLFYTGHVPINGLSVAEDKLLVCEQLGSDSGRVTVLTGLGQVDRVLQAPDALGSPRQALLVQGEAWVADSLTGLSAWGAAGNEARAYIPNSPFGRTLGPMTIYQDPGAGPGAAGVLWVASGGADTNWMALHNHDGLYRLDGNGWTNYNSHGYPSLQGIFDFDAIGFNPRDTSLWVGSFGEGVLEMQPGDRFTTYAAGSGVGPALDDPSAYRVSGIAFDKDGNGWMANYGAAHDLLLRRADGQWFSFAIPFAHAGNALSQALVDNYNQVWMVSPKGNGVFCYNPGAVLENVSDDQWKYYRAGVGNGNLPDNHVYCLAKDKSGFIWIGTGNGIGLVQCSQQVFGSGGCEAIWPIVQFDAFAGYLFGGQTVQAIAVDGADRKWVGTRNGVWLISPDAQKIIYHFTADSTPLLSNDVRNIAIDPVTGEVFFATSVGLCSFRSTATAGGEQNSHVLVFPNPVPPDFTGTIAIRGLVDGAIVKITEVSGRLVYQTNALGGQAIWDGRDYRGRKVATGVYLVLVSDASRQEKMATKIIFIGR